MSCSAVFVRLGAPCNMICNEIQGARDYMRNLNATFGGKFIIIMTCCCAHPPALSKSLRCRRACTHSTASICTCLPTTQCKAVAQRPLLTASAAPLYLQTSL